MSTHDWPWKRSHLIILASRPTKFGVYVKAITLFINAVVPCCIELNITESWQSVPIVYCQLSNAPDRNIWPAIFSRRLGVPSNPKWATFTGVYFPKRCVKSNKNTLCDLYLLTPQNHEKYAFSKTSWAYLHGFIPTAYWSTRNQKVTWLNSSYSLKYYYYLCSSIKVHIYV